MNVVRRNRLSIFLMTGSLLLLLLFLCFWLRKVYAETYEGLKKDTNYLFAGAIRAIEDQMLENLYGAPFSVNTLDSAGIRTIKIQLGEEPEFFNRVAFLEEHLGEWQTDSTHKIAIRSKSDLGNDSGIFGSLALTAVIHGDSIENDSLLFINADTSVLSNLKEYIKKDIAINGIPLTYQIIKLKAEEDYEDRFVSNKYTDLISGESYALEYQQYQAYLLKKMWPEFLFSLFLFSCISIAFFVVYQSLRQQRKLAELKNDFVSNVTHELKTPIATVGVAIEALSDFEVLKNPERTKEYLDISKHELHRLSILVDKVLKLSLFEKQEPELHLEGINFNDLIPGILDTMKLQFEKLNASVRFRTSVKEAWVKGDKTHLTSVLYNLIDNALKYSSGPPAIAIALKQIDQEIELTVEDQGIGIPPEYKNKIFEKFFRVPTGDQHNIKGYGLGLSYVASVLEKHQGRIEVESNFGSGTCFRVYLPIDFHN